MFLVNAVKIWVKKLMQAKFNLPGYGLHADLPLADNLVQTIFLIRILQWKKWHGLMRLKEMQDGVWKVCGHKKTWRKRKRFKDTSCGHHGKAWRECLWHRCLPDRCLDINQDHGDGSQSSIFRWFLIHRSVEYCWEWIIWLKIGDYLILDFNDRNLELEKYSKLGPETKFIFTRNE